MNTTEYLRGMGDCKDGKPQKEGQSKDYDNGYGTEYSHEQVQNQISESKYGMARNKRSA